MEKLHLQLLNIKKPTKNGQKNIGSIGLKYAYYQDNIVVLLKTDGCYSKGRNKKEVFISSA